MANRVITPKAILSYPRLFEPDEKGKFSAALVFPPGTDLKELKAAVVAVAVEKFGEAEAKKMIKAKKLRVVGGPHHSIRDDAEAKGYPEGSYFINARSNRKPGIVDAALNPVTDKEIMYPGVFVRASVTPFWYEKDGNKGVGWALNNLQRLQDGERLDNVVAAADEFERDEDAIADLADLADETSQEDETEAEEEEDLAALLK